MDPIQQFYNISHSIVPQDQPKIEDLSLVGLVKTTLLLATNIVTQNQREKEAQQLIDFYEKSIEPNLNTVGSEQLTKIKDTFIKVKQGLSQGTIDKIDQKMAGITQQIKIDALRREANKKGRSIHVKDPSMSDRTLVFTPEGRVLKLLNKTRLGDTRLGKGAYKTVSIAQDLFTKEIFASASMNLDKSSDQELENLKMLAGTKGFVQLISHVEYEGKRGNVKRRIFLKLADLGDLDNAIETGTLTDAARKKMVQQLLEGLVTMDKLGFIHRDLKPANIFIAGRDDFMIGDVGTACRTDDAERKQQHITTPWYTSPENAVTLVALSELNSKFNTEMEAVRKAKMSLTEKNAKLRPIREQYEKEKQQLEEQLVRNTTPKLDVWSFGCIVYQSYFGSNSLPWARWEAGIQETEVYRLMLASNPQELPPIPDSAVQALVSRCLEKDPAKRATVSELQQLALVIK